MGASPLIQIYRCLCDETRLRLVHLLTKGPLCVCHFQSALQLPQVAISKHLAYLREHGLAEAHRHEQWMIYRLPVAPSPELGLQLRCLQDCVQTHPVFKADCWIASVLPPSSDAKKKKKAKAS
jgi:DNA-binding transcriptional ArsR family regulator